MAAPLGRLAEMRAGRNGSATADRFRSRGRDATTEGWWAQQTFDGMPMFEVLRRRDIQPVFAFLQAHGWSRAAIASATGLSETRVRSICQGKQQVTSYTVFERIAEGLHIPRGWMGLAYTEPDAHAQQPPISRPVSA